MASNPQPEGLKVPGAACESSGLLGATPQDLPGSVTNSPRFAWDFPVQRGKSLFPENPWSQAPQGQLPQFRASESSISKFQILEFLRERSKETATK